MRWICVKNNVVENIVEADQTFAENILSQMYDKIETFQDINSEPKIGHLYDPNTLTYSEPTPVVDPNQELSSAIKQVKLGMLEKTWSTMVGPERKLYLGLDSEVTMQDLIDAGLVQ